MEISFFLKNPKISRQKCEGKIGVIDGFLRGWRAYKKGKIKENYAYLCNTKHKTWLWHRRQLFLILINF